MTEPRPDMDLFQARADQIRPSLRLEGARSRLYHPDRQTWIRGWIHGKYVELTRGYEIRGDVIRPEFRSFESFLSESRRRQSETAFRREFNSFEDFVSDLRSRRRDDDPHESIFLLAHSFEDFLFVLDLFEEFMFISDLCRLQIETEAGPELNQFRRFWYDLTAFDDFMTSSDESDPEESGRSADRLSGSNRQNLLAALPVVESATLPEGEKSCPICMEQYHDDIPSTTDAPAGTAAAISSAEALETEPAIRLRCNHVLGKTCLASWLASGHTTCPFCRADVRTPRTVVVSPTSALWSDICQSITHFFR
ncbi:hypothetical protein MMC07_008796 [Pseudocyphellaria aurata]|nr:hypothetical protein [Pseudocyphellaria aurata]